MSQSGTNTFAFDKTLSSLRRSDDASGHEMDHLSTDIKSLVFWLENRKIRSLSIPERSETLSNSDWDTAISQYLTSLHCPFVWGEDSVDDCLTWLVDYAMNLEYEENGK